jgi:hypothetical protein
LNCVVVATFLFSRHEAIVYIISFSLEKNIFFQNLPSTLI